MRCPILTIQIKLEHDVVLTRQRARQIAALLGFDTQDQTRLATAVSEIARNAYRYAGGGKAEFFCDLDLPQSLVVCISDQGPGIKDLKAVLDGHYTSTTGLGLGILGARRLTDHFEIESAPGQGTRVWLKKDLSRGAPLTADQVGGAVKELAVQSPQTPLQEVQQQNQELLRTLELVRERQAEVERLNHELEDTNRGVVALYKELDERATDLRRASELKSHFLSNMTHELRTPLNSIIMLSRLMLSGDHGPLQAEHARQADMIRHSAESLLELVNDLLDLAKIEAGKVDVRPAQFKASEMLGALRGMFRPLVQPGVELRFVVPQPDLLIYSDEGKVSQILRNFISNALKFTERGQVLVKAGLDGHDRVVFSVADTGIGIAPEDQQQLFSEFTQIATAGKKAIKGTGLGLSLSRRLAEILGGRIELVSEPGVGSTFSVHLPLRYQAGEAEAACGDVASAGS